MAALGVKVTAWQNATPFQRRVLRLIGDRLALGEPARFLAGGGVEWFGFDDDRFGLVGVAYLGRLLARLAEIDAQTEAQLESKTDAEIRQIIRNQLDDVVLPDSIAYTDGGNLWQETLDANGAPAAVQMGPGVPDTWSPVVGVQ